MIRLLPLILLAACAGDRDPIVDVQTAVAQAVVPMVVAAREIVEPVSPPAEIPPASARGIDLWECPAAIDLIVQFEVVSESYYTQRLQGVICPPAASGPTWGIGYDGGFQTRTQITQDWSMHPDVDRLTIASGVTGPARCRPLVSAELSGVRTPLLLARPVFAESTLPRYNAMAARAFSDGWDRLTPCARGALRSLTYNRGTGMAGSARTEMRTIRDECVPVSDAGCIARELRSMVRIWLGTDIENGMRRRRYAEADLAMIEWPQGASQ